LKVGLLDEEKIIALGNYSCLFTYDKVICYISSFPFNGKCELFEGWPT